MKICIIKRADILRTVSDAIIFIVETDSRKNADIDVTINRRFGLFNKPTLKILTADWEREGCFLFAPADVTNNFLPGSKIIFFLKNKKNTLENAVRSILKNSEKYFRSTIVVDIGIVDEYQDIAQPIHEFLSDSVWVNQLYLSFSQSKMNEKMKRNFGLLRIQTL